MLLDKFALFEDKLALSALAVATTVSTGSYDTFAAGSPNPVGPGGAIGGTLLHDVGRGRPILLLAQIGSAATSGGAPTFEEDFVAADDGALVTNKYVVAPGPAAIPLATLVAGYRLPFHAIPGKIQRRFIGTQHIVGTAVYTGGTLSVGLALGTDDHADILGPQP